MSNVTLKGSKEGFVVIINDESDFRQALKDLKELILKQNIGSADDDVIQFTIKTGNRLLTDAQIKEVKKSFTDYPQIEIKDIISEVESKIEVSKLLKANKMNIETGIVRSGQKLEFEGDVLFLGVLHEGAQISTNGSVYILGRVNGIVQAGYPDNTNAVIFGNLKHAAQLRIADVIEIVTDDNADKLDNHQFAYIDDMHSISVNDLADYKEVMSNSRKRTV
ncbi:septum site-determining protein MinC [Companilactobacillus nodensis]|uniref:Probable septum site-determining protein MinC n=1 Tax=Companilactobacillus nodensis DSM 19682 = JCM 14932 = NBRC 107160 TaxID=1423775 RepID=A0A0R1KBF4_9LACO|nr:septum site-determining protein MinC [Companilactobacillus nodensis]KRK80715.1 septum formation inhibitor [Companilactobacillus nodensis DSM 19682 = JCM 14932 = NBRC 107160]